MTELNPPPLLSVVVPMYNESAGIDLFFEKLTPALDAITQNWEIICIDDGSQDETLPMLREKCASDARIKALSFSRNFGKEIALSAGLDVTNGDAVIPMDADLQHPPELIAEMIAEWNKGYMVVLAKRRVRLGESWLKRKSAMAFYKILNKISSVPIPENTGDFRLMDRKVVEMMRLLPERTRFMKGLFAWVGFKTTCILFDQQPRAAGDAKQSVHRLLSLAKDGIFSFTTLPLRLMTYMGVVLSLVAFVYVIILLVQYVLYGRDAPGYTSIMMSVLAMGGIQLICLGILGEYIGRIYHESKQRPLYIVQEKHGL